MRPATTLTLALLLMALLGAAVVAFAIRPNSTPDCIRVSGAQTVACETPSTTANQ